MESSCFQNNSGEIETIIIRKKTKIFKVSKTRSILMRSRIRIDPLAQKERDRGEADERVDMSKEKY